jgi:hypothetical protein
MNLSAACENGQTIKTTKTDHSTRIRRIILSISPGKENNFEQAPVFTIANESMKRRENDSHNSPKKITPWPFEARWQTTKNARRRSFRAF